MARFTTHIRGIERLQSAAERGVEALKPAGAFGEAVRYTTLATHRYAVPLTPVDTGAWRASHRPEVGGLTGRIFIDPSATNPESDGRPVDYGAELELTRGGRYAVYKRTVDEAGPGILREAGEIIERGLP